MGGAVTNITAVKHGLAVYDPDVVQGTVLERSEIDRQIELYRSRDAEARRSIVGLQPKRADVILAGALIVRTVMDKLGQAIRDGERPRPSPRAAGRSIRLGLTGLGVARPRSEMKQELNDDDRDADRCRQHGRGDLATQILAGRLPRQVPHSREHRDPGAIREAHRRSG